MLPSGVHAISRTAKDFARKRRVKATIKAAEKAEKAAKAAIDKATVRAARVGKKAVKAKAAKKAPAKKAPAKKAAPPPKKSGASKDNLSVKDTLKQVISILNECIKML